MLRKPSSKEGGKKMKDIENFFDLVDSDVIAQQAGQFYRNAVEKSIRLGIDPEEQMQAVISNITYQNTDSKFWSFSINNNR
jgi:hypothetical protein